MNTFTDHTWRLSLCMVVSNKVQFSFHSHCKNLETNSRELQEAVQVFALSLLLSFSVLFPSQAVENESQKTFLSH